MTYDKKKMTYEWVADVIYFLKKDNGYKEIENNTDAPWGRSTLLEKQAESRSMGKVDLRLQIAQFDTRAEIIEMYTVTLVANKKNIPVKLGCYAIKRNKILQVLPEVEKTLIRLFDEI